MLSNGTPPKSSTLMDPMLSCMSDGTIRARTPKCWHSSTTNAIFGCADQGSVMTASSALCSSTLTPFTVWVLTSFIKQVPYEIEEAAIIDGASLRVILWRILLPLTTPGLVTMGVINFINAWNNLP